MGSEHLRRGIRVPLEARLKRYAAAGVCAPWKRGGMERMVIQHAAPTAEEQWQAFASAIHGRFALFFDGQGRITGARAPARLDILGGIADYAGSAGLEGTLGAATLAAVQARSDTALRLWSIRAADSGYRAEVTIPLSRVMKAGAPRAFAD